MKKRVIALGLIGCLLAGIFCTACGESEDVAVNETEELQEGSEQSGSTATEGDVENTKTDNNVTALSLMKETNLAQTAVIDDDYRTYYEVFVYSFYDSDGDGIGDLNGLIQNLDYINDGDDTTDTDLGCNGLWLMPIMPSMTYHKYDVTDYESIDPEYGTMEDFNMLVEECHARGMNVIIDFVMNHTSSQHEWFKEAYTYLQSLPEGTEPDLAECPYVDYYNFTKEKQGGFSQVEGTEWYYEAQFWSEMPDLNLDSEAVRSEFEEIVDYWLNLGVDGFRLDAIKEYDSVSDEHSIQILTWFTEMVKSKKEDTYLVGEAWNDSSVYSKYYASGIDSCFDFAFANSDGIIANTIKKSGKSNAASFGANMAAIQNLLASYNENYVDAPFYTNHDMARGAGYYSGDDSEKQTKIAQAMNLLMSGSAFLYYGEELGMKGSGKDENKRAPMYWSEDENATGMCDGPADMDTVKMKYESFEKQKEDGNSIYNYVKEVIALRNEFPAIGRGQVTLEESLSNDNVCAIQKTYENETILILYNISAETETVSLSGITVGDKASIDLQIVGTLLTGTERIEMETEEVVLPPYSIVILK